MAIAQARVEVVDGWLKSVEEERLWIEQRLNEFRREIEAKAGTGQANDAAGASSQRPFVVALPPATMESAEEAGTTIDSDEIWEQLRSRGLNKVLENAKQTLEEVAKELSPKRALRDWLACTVGNSADLQDRCLPLLQAIDEARDLAAPAWDYQDAWMSNPGAQPEEIFIVGIDEKRQDEPHPLQKEELETRLAGNLQAQHRLQYVATGDPYRIYIYRIEASIPAFVLQGIEAYREKYRELAKHGRCFHIDRTWEENGLPELMPVAGEKEAARTWVLARLFGVVRDDPQTGSYYFQSTREGEQRRYDLGVGLARAFEQLRDDFFAYKDVETQVAVKFQEHKRSLEKAKRFQETLEEARNNRQEKLETPDLSEKDRAVVKRELEAIDRLLKEIGPFTQKTPSHDFPTV